MVNIHKLLIICDYEDSTKDVTQKLDRLQAIEYFKNLLAEPESIPSLVIPNFAILAEMISHNIFRKVRYQKISKILDLTRSDQQGEELSPSWPYLKGIYEFYYTLLS